MTKMTHVGLDVHKDTIAIAKLRPGAEVPLVWEIPNDPKALSKVFGKMLAEAYELRALLRSRSVRIRGSAPARQDGDRVRCRRAELDPSEAR